MKAQKEAGLLAKGAPKGNQNAAKQKVSGKPVESPITLAEVGIDKGLADRARKYAAVESPFRSGLIFREWGSRTWPTFRKPSKNAWT
jgi:hypothetical protein